MKTMNQSEPLRSKLIIAGIDEINQHGIVDFSLRRVATSCGASCAAPYKHFNNKNELILEIIKYINNKWQLLEEQIIKIYRNDLKTLIIELSLANIRFKLANPDFRTILMISKKNLVEKQINEISKMSDNLSKFIITYYEKYGSTVSELKRKQFLIKSIIYGAVIQTESLELSCIEETMDIVKLTLSEILS